MKSVLFTILFFFSLNSLIEVGLASINEGKTIIPKDKILNLTQKKEDNTTSFDEYKEIKKEVDPYLATDTENYIPLSIKEEDSQAKVFRKILDHNVSNLLDNPTFKQSPLIKTANKLEQTLKTDISINENKNGNNIKHTFSLQFLAFQNTASVKYKGLIDADFSYALGKKHVDFILNQKINNKTKIIFNHSSDAQENKSMLNLNFIW